MYDPESWQNRAQCFTRGVDPALMQPDAATRAEVEEAKAVCVGCPVLIECHAHAEEQSGGLIDSFRSAYGVHAGAWFGHNPVWMVAGECEECGEAFRAQEKEGALAPRFCSPKCGARSRQRAKRERERVA